MATVDEIVKTVVIAVTGEDPGRVTVIASLVEDLGADELDIIEIQQQLDSIYDISMNWMDSHLVTVGDLIDFVKSKLETLTLQEGHSEDIQVINPWIFLYHHTIYFSCTYKTKNDKITEASGFSASGISNSIEDLISGVPTVYDIDYTFKSGALSSTPGLGEGIITWTGIITITVKRGGVKIDEKKITLVHKKHYDNLMNYTTNEFSDIEPANPSTPSEPTEPVVYFPSIYERLKLLIQDRFGVEVAQIQGQHRFVEDFGADSLDLVELVADAEVEFNIDIPDGAGVHTKTVRQAYDFLVRWYFGAPGPDAAVIYQRLKNIVMSQLQVDETQITLTSSFFNDLGADSTDMDSIKLSVEETFNIVIPGEAAEMFNTIGDVNNYLIEHT